MSLNWGDLPAFSILLCGLRKHRAYCVHDGLQGWSVMILYYLERNRRWRLIFASVQWVVKTGIPPCLRVQQRRVLLMHLLTLSGNLLNGRQTKCLWRAFFPLHGNFHSAQEPFICLIQAGCIAAIHGPFSVTGLCTKTAWCLLVRELQTWLIRQVNFTVVRQSSMLALFVSRLMCKARQICSLLRLVL